MFAVFFKKKKLQDVLNETKVVRIQGIYFLIKKINMLDYLAGSQVLIQAFDSFKTPGQKPPVSDSKIKKHYADVLIAGVVDPALTVKKEGPEDKAILVEDMFTNWDLVNALYEEIMFFTYGKKKLQHAISAARSLSK